MPAVPKPKKKAKKKKKPLTLTQLKAELHCVFSWYVRIAGSNNGKQRCFTCRKEFLVKELQNGHYIERGRGILAFDEINCQPQCAICNCSPFDPSKRGNHQAFALYLVKKYGPEVLEELEGKKYQTKQWKSNEVIDLITTYSEYVAQRIEYSPELQKQTEKNTRLNAIMRKYERKDDSL